MLSAPFLHLGDSGVMEYIGYWHHDSVHCEDLLRYTSPTLFKSERPHPPVFKGKCKSGFPLHRNVT